MNTIPSIVEVINAMYARVYEIEEHVECLEENIHEVRAEMANEVAMFGDSWVGSVPAMHAKQETLYELKDERAKLLKAIEAQTYGIRF